MDIQMFRNCCTAIMHSSKCSDYAKSYAEMGSRLSSADWHLYNHFNRTQEEMIRIQVSYILNNIQHWREPAAKEVRGMLKQIAKEI